MRVLISFYWEYQQKKQYPLCMKLQNRDMDKNIKGHQKWQSDGQS